MLWRSLSWMSCINRNHIYGLCAQVWVDITVNISLARCRVLVVCTNYLSKLSATGGLGLMLVSFFPQKMPVCWMWGFAEESPFHVFSQGCDAPAEWEGRERKELPGSLGRGQRDVIRLDWTKLDHFATRDLKIEFRQPHSAVLHHYTKPENTQVLVFKCQNPSA